MYRLYRGMTIKGDISMYSVHFCVDITQLFLTNTLYGLDHKNSVIGRFEVYLMYNMSQKTWNCNCISCHDNFQSPNVHQAMNILNG